METMLSVEEDEPMILTTTAAPDGLGVETVLSVEDETMILEQEAVAESPNRELTVSEQKRLMPALLRLRQACCHPQASLTRNTSVLCVGIRVSIGGASEVTQK